MESSQSRLSTLQSQVLRAFFEREGRFFLTGGGALVGYHLGHRETLDLDLFTLSEEAFLQAERVLHEVADGLGAELNARQRAPAFLRLVLECHGEGVVVDLVHDRTPQVVPEKEDHEGIRVDPAREILANKLTTLLGRAEERDLVDVYFLERAGLRVEDAIEDGAHRSRFARVLVVGRDPGTLNAGIASGYSSSSLAAVSRQVR